jgi:hypothetical protein
MVRRIKGCSVCKRRFIADGSNVSACAWCCSDNNDDNNNDDSSEAPAGQNKKLKPTPTPLHNEESSHNNYDHGYASEEEGACSENGDDIHCTQIVGDDESSSTFDNDDDEVEVDVHGQEEKTLTHDANIHQRVSVLHRHDDNHSSTELVKKSPIQQQHQQQEEEQYNENICFVCGRDLTGLKRRLDHIKRCSKKHNVTGRDVRVDTEYEDFVVDNRKAGDDDKDNSNTWRLAQQQSSAASTTSSATTPATNQMSMTSFVTRSGAPLQNLNNVLLAGAKRLSKIAEISGARKAAAPGGAKGGKSKRGSFSRRDYSKVCMYSYSSMYVWLHIFFMMHGCL